jgi:hypothetical protein
MLRGDIGEKEITKEMFFWGGKNNSFGASKEIVLENRYSVSSPLSLLLRWRAHLRIRGPHVPIRPHHQTAQE